MNNSIVIKLVDLLSFTALTLMVSTGILVKYTLPTRSGGDTVWGMTRHEWGDVHFYISLAFLLLMSSHLFLHIKFIRNVFRGKATTENNYRVAIGIVGIIALILLALSPVVSPVTDIQKGQQGHYNRH